MQSSWEKALIIVAFALVLALVLTASISFVYLLSRPGLAEALSALARNPWWLTYREPGPRGTAQPLSVIAATVAATGAGLIVSLRAYRMHRRTKTPVIPYLILFFLSLGTECLRGPTALIFTTNASIPSALVLTRVVYWGRYVGLFALLLSSLYCIDMKYRHTYVLGGGALLVAFALASSIPLDRTMFLSELVWKLGDEEGVWFTNIAIAVLILATTAGAVAIKRSQRYLVLALGFLLLLGARELLFFSVIPILLACGIAVLAVGAVVCLRSLVTIYRVT